VNAFLRNVHALVHPLRLTDRQTKGPFDSSPNEHGYVSLEFRIDTSADSFINITTFTIAPARLGIQVILRRIFAS